jgi:hypothetical protein
MCLNAQAVFFCCGDTGGEEADFSAFVARKKAMPTTGGIGMKTTKLKAKVPALDGFPVPFITLVGSCGL